MLSNYQSEINLFLGSYQNLVTRTSYSNGIDRFMTFITSQSVTDLNDVNLELLELFKAYLESNYSAKTSSMTVGHIKQLFDFLIDRKAITSNQSRLLKATKLSSREQKTAYLTEAEVKRLLSVVYNLPDVYQRDSNIVMVLLMINAGLRRDELSNLKRSHIKVIEGKLVLQVIGKGMRHRLITLSRPVAVEVNKALDNMGIHGDNYVIKGNDRSGASNHDHQVNPSTIIDRVKKLCRLADITKDVSPHSLRRTCATLMYKKNVPIEVIQRILGHDQVATTQRYIDMEADIDLSDKHALEIA